MEFDIDPSSLLEVSLIEENESVFKVPTHPSVDSGEVDSLSANGCLENISGDTSVHCGTRERNRRTNGEEVICKEEYNCMGSHILFDRAAILSEVEPKEQTYRHRTYRTLNVVLKKRLHCSVCDVHIGCSLPVLDSRIIHPLLKVLICVSCSGVYSGSWTKPTEENNLCRWCGLDGNYLLPPCYNSGLRNCSSCPYTFCERCIFRNFPLDNPENPNWVCFVCNLYELWPQRALCWALVALLNNLASREVKDPVWSSDISECCKNLKRKSSKEASVSNFQSALTRRGKSKLLKKIIMSNGELVGINGNTPKRTVDTVWLKSKIKCISTNLTVISRKLISINNDLKEHDSEMKVSDTLNSLHSLINLANKQLNDYSEDLKRDWASRRFNHSCHSKSKNGYHQISLAETQADGKRTVSNLVSNYYHYYTLYNIKECYVKLEKCSVPH